MLGAGMGAGSHNLWALRFEYRVDDLSIQSEKSILARPGPALVPLSLLVLRLAGTEALARQRIQSCLDVAMLERWLERALRATRLSEVLDGPPQ